MIDEYTFFLPRLQLYTPRRQQDAAELLATVFASFDDETVGTTKLLPTFTAQHHRRTQCGECGHTTKNGSPEPETILQVRGVRGNDQFGIYVSENENRDGGTLRIPSSRVRGSTSGGDLNDHNSSSHGQTRNGDHNRVEREREEPEGVAQRSRSAKGAADLC